MIFDNGVNIEEEELKKCQSEIVDVLKKHTDNLKLAKIVLNSIDLDDFSILKDC